MSDLVTVHQLMAKTYGKSRVKTAFMNVDSDYGYVEVTTITSNPTFLVARKMTISLIQFNDEAWAKDWFTRHQAYIEWIARLQYDDVVYTVLSDLKDYLLDPDDPAYPGRLDEEVTDADRKEQIEELLGEVYVHLDQEKQERVREITKLLRELS